MLTESENKCNFCVDDIVRIFMAFFFAGTHSVQETSAAGLYVLG